MKLFDMMTSEDIKRLNDSNIEELKERIKELESSRPLNTMDEVAYRELEARIKELEGKCRQAGRAMIELNLKYETSLKEIDRLSEENTNLKTMMKGSNGNK